MKCPGRVAVYTGHQICNETTHAGHLMGQPALQASCRGLLCQGHVLASV